MIKFIKNDDGLVTIEWVGIAAVMVLAAIAVTAFIMNGTTLTSEAIEGKIATQTTNVTNAPVATYTPPAP